MPYRLPEEVLNDDGFLPWLPDPIRSSEEDTEYLPFNEAVERETTESFRPSLREAVLDDDRTSDAQYKDILVSAKVRTTVCCIACDKPQCVYSKYALTPSAIAWVKTVAEEILYVCGSPLSTDPQAPWVVRRALTYESPVEITYYGSKKFSNLCCFCCNPDCYVNQELKQNYQTVLPICRTCESKEKLPVTRGKLKKPRQQKRSEATYSITDFVSKRSRPDPQ